ncbi:MAG: DUF6807 family protein [Phycisphaerae bacterium]
MKSKRKFVASILAIISICGFSVASETEQIRLKVSVPNLDCFDVPVQAVIELPLPERLARVPFEEIRVWLRQDGNLYHNVSIPGQIVVNDKNQAELWWVLPEAKANSTSTWTAALADRRQLAARRSPVKVFSWRDEKGDYLDLLFNGRKVTRYIYAFDNSSKERILETYKTFHHVFDAEGKKLLTNGPDGLVRYLRNQILYPHHRGIFIGWNRLEFGGQRYDFWHMGEQGRVQKHQKFLELTAGPVLARSNSLVHWNNRKGETIIAEQRETTVFRQSAPTILLLDFQTKLKAVRGEVFLNGDPEHAGFQYRGHDDVAKGGKEVKATYLFHKDGIDPKKDHNLPWAAMSYGLNDRRYSVQHMNHPGNPKPTIYSAYRDYGRFGAFFKEEIRAGKTLTLGYRIWVGPGEMPKRQELADRYSAFVNGPKVEVLRR